MKRAIGVVLSGVLIALGIGSWAVPQTGAAHSPVPGTSVSARSAVLQQANTRQLPATVWFRDSEDRGLLADVWINGHGPYRFAIDTGAGITVVSQALATAAGLKPVKGRTRVLAGLSGTEVIAGESSVNKIALGNPNNVLPAKIRTVIVQTTPSGLDGILDPGDAYAPLGYTIDLPQRQIRAFDPRVEGLSVRRQPADGTVVPWLRDGNTNRPFVRLSDGRLALIDTGSTFGLAATSPRAVAQHERRSSRDIGGGAIRSIRVQPTTVSIGSLELRDVPTDVLDGVEKGAPTILGRDALYPFRISFDPAQRLIEFVPSVQDKN